MSGLFLTTLTLCAGDKQSVPKLPGFRWLYHREGKQLRQLLPLLTSMKSWATAACESSLSSKYFPIPRISSSPHDQMLLHLASQVSPCECFIQAQKKILPLYQSSFLKWPLAALDVDLRSLHTA